MEKKEVVIGEQVQATPLPEMSDEAKVLQADVNDICARITQSDYGIRKLTNTMPGFMSVANLAVVMATAEIIKEGLIAGGGISRESFLAREKGILISLEAEMSKDFKAAQVLAGRQHQQNGLGPRNRR